jgi:hypothetical protein
MTEHKFWLIMAITPAVLVTPAVLADLRSH